MCVKFCKMLAAAACRAAQALLLQRALEEHLYFFATYCEFVFDDGFTHVVRPQFEDVPWVLRGYTMRSVRKKMMRDLQGQVRLVYVLVVVQQLAWGPSSAA